MVDFDIYILEYGCFFFSLLFMSSYPLSVCLSVCLCLSLMSSFRFVSFLYMYCLISDRFSHRLLSCPCPSLPVPVYALTSLPAQHIKFGCLIHRFSLSFTFYFTHSNALFKSYMVMASASFFFFFCIICTCHMYLNLTYLTLTY